MKVLRRRIQKLEATLTDASGFAPYSPRWHEYWIREIGAYFDDPTSANPKTRFPLEAVRAYMAADNEQN